MNKQELKRLIEKTCVMMEGGKNKLIEPWIKIVESLGLEYEVREGVGGKFLCVSKPGGTHKVFNNLFIKLKFPTLEQFFNYGDKLRGGDYVLNAVETVDYIHISDCGDWNKNGSVDKYINVIFAKCWLDEPKQKLQTTPWSEFMEEKRKQIPDFDEKMDAAKKSIYPAGTPETENVPFKCKYSPIVNRHPHADKDDIKIGDNVIVDKELGKEFGMHAEEEDFAYDEYAEVIHLFKTKRDVSMALVEYPDGSCIAWRECMLNKKPTKVKRWVVILANGDEIYHTKKPDAMLNSSTIREIEIEL